MLPKLKLLRKEKGISQQKLADAIGVSQQSINQYENHSVEPDIAVLCAMADHFETTIDYIVDRTQERGILECREACELNSQEYDLVERFRRLDKSQRQVIQSVLDALVEKT